MAQQAVQNKMGELIASIPESNRYKLDKEIDFENKDIKGRTKPQHLGKIAEQMINWEGDIADNLGLTFEKREDILQRNSRRPDLQRYGYKVEV